VGIVNFHDSFLQAYCVRIATKGLSLCRQGEGIGEIRFRPVYAWANMGHLSRTIDLGLGRKTA
jgi:hypothetical protein